MRQTVVDPGENGCWVAECPSLPGRVSQGQTKQDAIADIKAAVAGYVAALEEDGLPVPDFRPGGEPPNPLIRGAFAGLEDGPSIRKVEGCRNGRSIIVYLNLYCEAGRE